MRIPRHLAIIMDGNGRWAEQRSLPRIAGHHRGVETVQAVVEECRTLGVKYLTLYAFSSENWGRPDEEVSALMELLSRYLESELDSMLSRNIRFQVIGESSRLPVGVRETLQRVIDLTSANTELVLTLALSYGSRNELVRAARAIACEVVAGRRTVEQIDDALFDEFLDTHGMPDPDLLIRTSGEMRISNFLLWQMAYTELYFSEALWPEFSSEELHVAFREFARRQRRFGLTAAQICNESENRGEDSH